MGHMKTLTAADGHVFSAYEAGSPDQPYAVVVVQEIFGVNAHMRRVCDDFAERGFHVICPALFDRAEPGIELGYDTAGREKGLALRAQITLEDSLQDIYVCAQALEHAGGHTKRKIGIIGYCWGGTLAWVAATQSKRFDASVCWYGGGIAARRDETPNCPVEMHFGGEDHSIPHMDVLAIRDAQPGVEIFVYDDAGHGFGCADRASFNQEAYMLAQQRSVAFLESHLQG
ncbi:dienelactone hydrolase family protein [Acetobacter indonesiensis]